MEPANPISFAVLVHVLVVVDEPEIPFPNFQRGSVMVEAPGALNLGRRAEQLLRLQLGGRPRSNLDEGQRSSAACDDFQEGAGARPFGE